MSGFNKPTKHPFNSPVFKYGRYFAEAQARGLEPTPYAEFFKNYRRIRRAGLRGRKQSPTPAVG